MLKIFLVVICLTKIETKIIAELSKSSVLLSAALNIISEESKSLSTLNMLISEMDCRSKVEAREIINSILLNESSKPIATQLLEVENLRPLKTKKIFYMFFINSYKSFYSIYAALSPTTFNYHGRYLIILIKNPENIQLDIQKIFHDLWSIHIVNVDVLQMSPDENVAELYTFFPYTSVNCSEVHPVLWKTFQNGQFVGPESFYPKKMANLHQCSLKVVTFNNNFITVTNTSKGLETVGLDGEILKVLAKEMNFSIAYTLLGPFSWGNVYPNGSSNGAINYVINAIILAIHPVKNSLF